MTEAELRLQRARRLAVVLDGAWGIPFTPWRIGVDSLLGLLPVAGDALGALLGLGIVWQARQLQAPASLQRKMMGNIAIDLLVGSVPLVGDIADIALRKNQRNVELLEKWLTSQRGSSPK